VCLRAEKGKQFFVFNFKAKEREMAETMKQGPEFLESSGLKINRLSDKTSQ
jgi:hypothetical protein